MAATWPLVGRDEELELLRSQLRDVEVSGLVLSGVAGTGKSRLARELLRVAAEAGHPSERIVASRAAASIPFGPFAHLLPAGVGAPTAGALRTAADALAERGGSRRLVLVVDDAHLLDDASVALLHRVMLERTVFTLATVRTGDDPVSDAVVALWKDVDAARLEVQALSRDETTELAEVGLGGSLDAGTARALWEASAGNPLYLREIVLAARAAGTLRRERGLWTTDSAPLAPPASLADLVELRLRDLSADALRATEVLATADVLGLATLTDLHDESSVTELEGRGLLQVDDDGRRRPVRLAHPLYGEVVRRRSGAARTRAVARELADVVERAGARRREDALQLAVWRMHAGEVTDAAPLVEAAREIYARGSYDLASELLGFARRIDPSDAESALLSAQLHHEHGRHAEAEAIYAGLPAVPHAATVRVAVQRAVNLFFGLGDEDAAAAVLTEAAGRVPDRAGELAVNRAWLRFNAGWPLETLDLVGAVDAGDDTDLALMIAVTTAWAETAAGRPLAGLAAAESALALRDATAPTRLNRFRDFPELPRALALLVAGDGRASAAIEEGRTTAVDRQPRFVHAWWSFLAGRLALRGGALDEAADAFREGAVIQSTLRQPGLLRRDLAGLALVAALRGDLEGARRHLAEHDEAGDRPERLHAAGSERARAWTAWAGGDAGGAVSVLTRAVADARRRGCDAAEAELLHDLVRLGVADGVADRLATLATEGGPLVEVRAAHAAALAAADGHALTHAAERLAASGAVVAAADAYGQAVVAFGAAGEPRAAGRPRRAAAELRGRVAGLVTPALARSAEPTTLTAREREVVGHAVAGRTNREIAETLGIAKRTVDNLLHRSYAKLGVNDRQGAGRVLGLTPPTTDAPTPEDDDPR